MPSSGRMSAASAEDREIPASHCRAIHGTRSPEASRCQEAAADSACGYAALSLMPAGAAVLSIEFKTNVLAPADGERFIARGKVIKPGRTIMVCDATVHAVRKDGEKLVATMTGTMMVVTGRGIYD